MSAEMEKKFCTGCDKHCEFDCFARTRTGAIYPTIGTKIIQSYSTTAGKQVYISVGEVRNRKDALILADKISKMCRHYQKER